eukprot:scaffold7087_cov168-Amphora_coffeaeformis.AAC.1
MDGATVTVDVIDERLHVFSSPKESVDGTPAAAGAFIPDGHDRLLHVHKAWGFIENHLSALLDVATLHRGAVRS